MSSYLRGEQRLVWSFWVAAALAAVGGLAPFLAGGTSSRIASVSLPFEIAAIALAGCGIFHAQGRAVTGGLYFFAGLALVYGLLSMFALPLQLAVLGTCAAPPAPCTGGLARPLTVAENTGMGFATGFAVASLFVGFFGLMVVFRRTVLPPSTPPVRTIPAVPPARTPERAEVTPTPAEVTPAPAEVTPASAEVTPTPAANGSAPPLAEPELELPPHEEEDLPELPPHESSPPTT